MSSKLRDRWALITGASRGVGREIAIALAQRGCNVVAHARRAEHLADTRDAVTACGVEFWSVAGSLDTAAGVAAVLDGVQAAPAPIDIVYNNAGVQVQPQPICAFDRGEWEWAFQVNLFAPVQLCNALVPGMVQRGFGRVVQLTSGIAEQPHLVPYTASKSALDAYTRELAFAYRDTPVRVNLLDPGWLRTDLGGPEAWHAVDTVIPGALEPVLVADDGPTGAFYAAQDYRSGE